MLFSSGGSVSVEKKSRSMFATGEYVQFNQYFANVMPQFVWGEEGDQKGFFIILGSYFHMVSG
jgi:hypothetical protein